MRVARRTFLASTLASVAAPAVMRLASADALVTFKLHHFMSSVSSGHDKFLVPWARKVEADSGGRIRIDLFPSMQLGGAPAQLFDQARDGVADIVWTMPGLTPGRFPKIEMFDLPFVPSRRALVSSKALEDFAAVNLKDEFHEVHPLGFSCSDRAVVHSSQPIRTVEDIKDLKLHVKTRFAGEAVRVLGGHPVPMPDAQLPIAITAHVVDGCLDPWHVVPSLRLNDLLKAHTEFSDLSLSSTTFVLAMNNDAYNQLPRDLKTVIDSHSGQFAADMAGAMWDLQAAAVADMVAQRGDAIVTLLPEAVAHWRKATDPVAEIWLKEMKEHKVDGGKLLASARALLTKYASVPEPQPPPPPDQQAVSEPQSRPDAKVDTKADTPAVAKPAASAAPPPKPASPAAPAPSVSIRAPAAPPSPPVVPPAPPPHPASAARPPLAKPAVSAPSAPTPPVAAAPAPVVPGHAAPAPAAPAHAAPVPAAPVPAAPAPAAPAPAAPAHAAPAPAAPAATGPVAKPVPPPATAAPPPTPAMPTPPPAAPTPPVVPKPAVVPPPKPVDIPL